MSISSYHKILLPHEFELLSNGKLQDVTHTKSRSVILEAPSASPEVALKLFVESSSSSSSATVSSSNSSSFCSASTTSSKTENKNKNKLSLLSQTLFEKRPDILEHGLSCVYRPIGDTELQFILDANGTRFPDTQPYHAIMRDEAGRDYSCKYLDGVKKVDTSPHTVIEVICPKKLIDDLFARQHKAEDGCLSHGLGFAAGKDLQLMNDWLELFSSCCLAKNQKKTQKSFENQQYYYEHQEEEYDEYVENNDDDEQNEKSEKDLVESEFLQNCRAVRIVKVKRKLS